MITATWLIARLLLAIGLLVILYSYLLRLERRGLGRLPLSRNERWGVFWPLVDTRRALLKRAAGGSAGPRRLAYFAGPILGLCGVLGALSLIPLLPSARPDALVLWSLEIGLLVVPFFSLLSLSGVVLSAWASGHPYVQREGDVAIRLGLIHVIPSLLALGGVVMLSGSLQLQRIVEVQTETWPYLLYQPLGCVLFSISFLLGSRRLPYRLPASPHRLLAEFHLQHAGGPLALYHFVDYLQILLGAALVSTLYLAGWRGPWQDGVHWLALKAVIVMLGLLWLRERWLADLVRRLGRRLWTYLTLLSLFNTLLTGVVLIWSR